MLEFSHGLQSAIISYALQTEMIIRGSEYFQNQEEPFHEHDKRLKPKAWRRTRKKRLAERHNHKTNHGLRTPSLLILSHEHFLLAMCLHGSLICYVCYVLNEDYRYCVKSIQFRVKLVAGYITDFTDK